MRLKATRTRDDSRVIELRETRHYPRSNDASAGTETPYRRIAVSPYRRIAVSTIEDRRGNAEKTRSTDRMEDSRSRRSGATYVLGSSEINCVGFRAADQLPTSSMRGRGGGGEGRGCVLSSRQRVNSEARPTSETSETSAYTKR